MTSTASDMPESDLLDTVITSHGDLDRCRSLDQLTAKVSAGGVLWGLKSRWPPKNSACNNNVGDLRFARTIGAVRSRLRSRP